MMRGIYFLIFPNRLEDPFLFFPKDPDPTMTCYEIRKKDAEPWKLALKIIELGGYL